MTGVQTCALPIWILSVYSVPHAQSKEIATFFSSVSTEYMGTSLGVFPKYTAYAPVKYVVTHKTARSANAAKDSKIVLRLYTRTKLYSDNTKLRIDFFVVKSAFLSAFVKNLLRRDFLIRIIHKTASVISAKRSAWKIPKCYTINRGDFSATLEMTVKQTVSPFAVFYEACP